MLEKNDVDKKLIELINNNLVSFGPRKSGPNLLINKYRTTIKHITW
jgi:hypothetical protein